MSRGGVDLFYTVEGAGIPVIVIHGGPGLHHAYLKDGLVPLSQHLQLIFYDQRATGQSGGEATPETITLQTFIQDLDALVRGLCPDGAHLMGHSWGALLALAYAERYPEKTKSLVLLNPIPMTAEGLHLYSYLVVASRPAAEQEKIAQLASSDPFLRGKREALTQYFSLWFKSDNLNLHLTDKNSQNVLKVNHLMLKNLGPFNLLEQADKVKCPVLIIEGDKDVIPLKYGEELSKKLPKAERVILKNVGHFSFLDDEEGVSKAVKSFYDSMQPSKV